MSGNLEMDPRESVIGAAFVKAMKKVEVAKMTAEEEDQFLRDLLEGKARQGELEQVEMDVVESFRLAQAKVVDVEAAIKKTEDELGRLRVLFQKLNGQCDALAGVLVQAEVRRRNRDLEKEMAKGKKFGRKVPKLDVNVD